MKRRHRTTHFAIWHGMALILPMLFIIAAVIRYQQTADVAPQQLTPPQVTAEDGE